MSRKKEPKEEFPESLNEQAAALDWLAGGGEMGEYIRAKDWSKTPLGSIETWPQSLRTTVSLCVASNFPISIAWGPKHTQIYNDGYKVVCEAKHPTSMGQDFSECWASAWPVIGEAFERALNGQTSFLEDQRMFLDRNGYLEETFFTFSFSPIRDETGGVGGLFHPATETTGKMLAQRRTRVLRDIADETARAKTSAEAYQISASVLDHHSFDIPFALLYEHDEVSGTAILAAKVGVPDESTLCPNSINLKSHKGIWELAKVVRSGAAVELDDLQERFGDIVLGPYPEPLQTALVMPISRLGHASPAGFLIAGVSSRLPLNETFRGLYDQVAAAISTAVANATAYEEERRQAEKLAELDWAKTTFFSNVSHEFRTPLTLMLGPLEELLNGSARDISPRARPHLELAYRNGCRLLKLVNSLLDFSRIEAGRMSATFEPIDLSLLTLDLASGFRSAIEASGLKLKINCPVLTQPVYVDRDMWEKIVLNLISNAFKFTFEGFISVTLKEHSGFVELKVEDSGVGVSRAELPRLFERFHRIDGQRSRTHEGSGIGLALVRELAGFHGGEISARSKIGKGTTFTVHIPLGKDHLNPDRVAKTATFIGTSIRANAFVEEASGWSPRVRSHSRVSAAPTAGSVLVVDDNADMLAYVSSLLSEEYEVHTASDGLEALQAIRRNRPDIVLSDVMMPNLDGFGLLDEIRDDPSLSNLPVILLSARAGEESKIEGLEAGADDYLVKPFSSQELLARVNTHIRILRERSETEVMLKELNAELERRAELLQFANEELALFSAAASHDLRGPLNRIGGFIDILDRTSGHLLDEVGKEALEIVQFSVVEMKELISSLLNLAMVTEVKPNIRSIDLSALALSTASTLQAESGGTAQFEIEPGLKVMGDDKLIAIALTNLMSNALKFTSKVKQPRIAIGQDRSDSRRPFFIRDNGAGFDISQATKLFTPFTRLHSSRDFVGSGVGLSTVHRIVSRHGGLIWANSAPGKGATFYFTLKPTKES